ncbi:recombinase family protein [Pseudodesulfovibrio sp.]|uniref:recombinase family protein n=1 Tax=unclassified Pseudodesulfovibrio TaxID=2661612 RepID=UPI003B00A8DF
MKAIKANADALAESLRATVEKIKEGGTTSFAGIAKELNAQKIKTARGGKWYPSSVKRALGRLELSCLWVCSLLWNFDGLLCIS